MSQSLDVYRDWLGIKDPERPLSYYQLLRLKRFDDNLDRIRRHYRRMTSHVRKYASGDLGAESQTLLNELARAMLCLTDAKRKSDYDASLGREKVGHGQRESMEQILLRQGVIDREQLTKAREFAEAVGFPLRDALLQKKIAPPESVMQAYAESLGFPYLDLSDITIDEELVPKVTAIVARQYSLAPLMVEGENVLLASPNPIDLLVEEDLKLRIGMPVRLVLCTPASIHDVINKHYPREAVEEELRARSADPPKEDVEPTGVEKFWGGVKKWVKDHS